jgi:hypothetical protein
MSGVDLTGVATTAPTTTGGARWLPAWAAERFPARNGVLFAVLYATALLVARATVGRATMGWRDVPGFVALWAFFLLLRVFDEHKDFAADAVAHPERVLQRGLVTLAHLRVVGAAAVVVQLAVSLWRDGGVGPATAWWLAALGWSLLMAREFFAPRWLRARLVPYALTHMLVMPLLVGWVMVMAAPAALASPAALPALPLAAALAFAAGLAVEVARKVRAPGDERPMADSYTRALGARGAMALLIVSTLAAGALAGSLAARLAHGGSVAPGAVALGVVAVGAGGAWAAWAAAAFVRAPSTGRAKRVEAATGVAVLLAHLLVIAAAFVARGHA